MELDLHWGSVMSHEVYRAFLTVSRGKELKYFAYHALVLVLVASQNFDREA